MKNGLGNRQRMTLRSYMGSPTIKGFDFSKQRRAVKTLTKSEVEKARQSLADFTSATKPDYELAWFHDVLCKTLDKVRTGEILKLIVELPPRHGKSELVSRRFPAMVLGDQPDTEIIACSYSATLASRMNRDVQRIMMDQPYKAIYPDSQLFGKNVRTVAEGGSWLRNNDIFEIVDHKGSYRSAGVGGGITGQGFDLGIIDDPYKDRKQANSAVQRAAVWEWYTSTFLTRGAPGCRQVVCHTRWHKHDLIGMILELEPEEWTVLRFPAIQEIEEDDEPRLYDTREEGEALWPSRYSVNKLMKLQKTIGPVEWASLFQQRPIIKGGDMFKPREWIKPDNYVKALPQQSNFKTLWYWDNAGTQDGGANTAGTLAGFIDGRFYIMRSVAGQWSAGNREAVKRAEAERAKALYKTVTIYNEQEPGSAGVEQFQNTTRTLAGFAVKADRVTGSKESRAEVLAAQMEAGNVYIYAPDDGDNKWIGELLDELESFPKGKRKDRVDSVTGAYNMSVNKKNSWKASFL